MKKQLTFLICWLLIVASLIFSGCEAKEPSQSPSSISIHVASHIPPAAVSSAYDLTTLVTEEEGISYEYTAHYTDPDSGEQKELNVRKGKIIPKAESDISVTVTAMKGEESSTVTFVVPIKISADIMDQLLATQNTEDVTIAVTKEAAYIHSENSSSALSVIFPGENISALINLSDYALQPYYTAQVWRNAAVSFWVYNPMSKDVSFKLAAHNPKNNVSMLWDSAENTQVQTAKAGAWTHIFFSLYDMGITEPLFDAVTYEKEDSLQVLAYYDASESCTVYVDKVDIVHAETIENLKTSFNRSPAPSGNFSDLLSICKVYTTDSVAQLEMVSQGVYRFGCNQPIGYPTFFVDFPQTTDISGFDYLKFDIFGENCYPYLSVSVRYLDEFGNIQQKGTFYDYYRNQWQTIYLNLDYLGVDLSRAVGISFAVHMDKNFVAGQYNNVSFDNVALYCYPDAEPQIPPAVLEDNDIISGTFYTTGTKPNVNGVCKVSADETGLSKSNSALLFWTNNACGYPNVDATFLFDHPQDWSNKNILSFDTHQHKGHYWLQFDILYLDENGNQQWAYWRYDTIMTNWQTNHASLDWFKTESGEQIKPQALNQVIGFKIAANMAINVTGEVAHIYFDNFVLS